MAEGTPLEIIGPGARRDRNIRPSNGVALAHFNANCGTPPWTTAAPLPLDRGENENHRLNETAMELITCMHTKITCPVGWVSCELSGGCPFGPVRRD
jgi:hypothetical protein